MRRRKRKDTKGLWIVLAIVIAGILIGAGVFKVYSVKNSPEFNASFISHYLLVNKDIGYFIRIDGDKRVVYIVKIKEYTYDPTTNHSIDINSPLSALNLLQSLLDIQSSYNYYVILNDTGFNTLTDSLNISTNNLNDFFRILSKRGLKYTDYFKFNGIIKALRPDTTLTAPALAKLLYAFRNYNIRNYDLPTLTEKPVKITVGQKTYERIYIDVEAIDSLKNAFRR
ncbi:hypothetical protein JYK00_04930 [Thermosipho ferrireducens]|uniref:Uncharacterized protein n=1 Tax=Thermosipho ferrireducens TaxID=2571116 RepID=A0ABX7S3Z0_9BACT|nr:hypothetical protein [Thermosipho ferrireducens]QTA37102.1 hypothetical protein JYK00_04930 [Thermosipho ferrireducens]